MPQRRDKAGPASLRGIAGEQGKTSTAPVSSDEEPEIMDVIEAAEFLRVSPATVRQQLAAKRLPGKRIGKEWRLSRTALIQWLSEPGEPKNYARRQTESA